MFKISHWQTWYATHSNCICLDKCCLPFVWKRVLIHYAFKTESFRDDKISRNALLLFEKLRVKALVWILLVFNVNKCTIDPVTSWIESCGSIMDNYFFLWNKSRVCRMIPSFEYGTNRRQQRGIRFQSIDCIRIEHTAL